MDSTDASPQAGGANQQRAPQVTSVWCHGDSLTEGYTYIGNSLEFHPYAAMMGDASNGRVVGTATGYSGKTTPMLEFYLDAAYFDALASKPTVFAVLGGTNDFPTFHREFGRYLNDGSDSDADADGARSSDDDDQQSSVGDRMQHFVDGIVAQLRTIARTAVSKLPPELANTLEPSAVPLAQPHGAASNAVAHHGEDRDAPQAGVVFITVPPVGKQFQRTAHFGPACVYRDMINTHIRHLDGSIVTVDGEGGPRAVRAVVADVATAVAAKDDVTVIADAFDSGDGLHLSVAGYAAMASCVAAAVQRLPTAGQRSQEPVPSLCWAFGASLTEGYTVDANGDGDVAFRPYAAYLEEVSNGAVRGWATGHTGFTTEQLLHCVGADYLAARGYSSRALGRSPSHVAVLGGTNDLGHLMELGLHHLDDAVAAVKSQTLANLVKISREIRRYGGDAVDPPTVIVITVPPLGRELQKQMGPRFWGIAQRLRAELNTAIVNTAAARERDQFTIAVDSWAALATAPTPETVDATLKPEFDCGDGIHLNDNGYVALAKAVAAAVSSSEAR